MSVSTQPAPAQLNARGAVLAVAAHPDDIELACGGTLIKHAAAGDEVWLFVVSNGEAGPGEVEMRQAEAQMAAEIMGVNIRFGGFPDGTVGNHQLELVHAIESLIRQTGARRIYTHGEHDSHQDHRAVALATFGAARQSQQVLCYDSPSSINFNPTVYIDISDSLDKKVEALKAHSSQVDHSSMASVEMVLASAKYRGFQARIPAAEGFIPHRLVADI